MTASAARDWFDALPVKGSKPAKLSDAVVVKACSAARDAARFCTARGKTVGACRVYVRVAAGIRAGSTLANTLAAYGVRVMARPGCTGRQIYVGYDNFGGATLAKGEAIAQALAANGVDADMDYDGD